MLRILEIQKKAESCPERFRDAAEVAGAVWKEYNGIIGVPLIVLVGDLMEDSWVCEELYETLRLPGTVCAPMVNKMFGAHRYVRISRGRHEFLLRLGAESRAFRVCKEREREERLALSWDRIALTFWASSEQPV